MADIVAGKTAVAHTNLVQEYVEQVLSTFNEGSCGIIMLMRRQGFEQNFVERKGEIEDLYI